MKTDEKDSLAAAMEFHGICHGIVKGPDVRSGSFLQHEVSGTGLPKYAGRSKIKSVFWGDSIKEILVFAGKGSLEIWNIWFSV